MRSHRLRVLFLPKYDRIAASTRNRFLNYFPSLEEAGFECSASPLLPEDYWTRKLSTGKTPWGVTAMAYLRRLMVLARVRRYDLVVIHCEAMPYLPALFERAVGCLGTPYAFDFDDAIFHNYDLSRRPAVRLLFGGKIRAIIRGAVVVLAGNRYLADYASGSSSRVEIFPTVVDTDVYRPAPPRRSIRPFRIGWVGSPSTAPYLSEIAPALARVCAEMPARLIAVGSGPLSLAGVPVEVRPWDEGREVEDLQEFDVGIMPLPDTPWARGKSGFKLIQYMACGIPAVASPVGANREILAWGAGGLLASTEDEWVEALRSILADPVRAAELGRRGRERVMENYSLASMAPRLARVLRESARPAARE